RRGASAYQLIDETLDCASWVAARGQRAGLARFLATAAGYDGVLCRSRDTALAFLNLLDAEQPQLPRPFKVGFLEAAARAPQAMGSGAVRPWQTCVDMLCDADHRNWLFCWRAGDRRKPAAATAATKVA